MLEWMKKNENRIEEARRKLEWEYVMRSLKEIYNRKMKESAAEQLKMLQDYAEKKAS